MARGITFSERAVGRIARTVHTVEHQAANLSPWRRRRGGPAGGPAPVQFKLFRVQVEFNDYVTAYPTIEDFTNQVDSTEPVYLAKPPMLRASEYQNDYDKDDPTLTWTNDSTDTRTAENESTSETQRIIPKYLEADGATGYLGQLVLAVKGIANGTGLYDPDQEAIVWQILDGRAWAAYT